jgi:serine/threonine protein kinase/class 3 adenylate cyclase
MQLGSYTLREPLEQGSFGAIFAAVDGAGGAVEVRLLDRAGDDPALVRRLRLLALLDHPVRLPVLASVLDSDPPYLVLLARAPWPDSLSLSKTITWGRRLAGFLDAAQRLGLHAGPFGREHLRVTEAENVRLDLTGTLPAVDPVRGEALTEIADVARLGALLASLPLSPERPAELLSVWEPLLKRMCSPQPEERPLFDEVATALARIDALGTREVPEQTKLGATMESVVPVPAHIPGVGDRLGRFRLIEKLGEGAMGAVFRALDEADGTLAAIKVMHAGRALSPDARRRFHKEARMLAELDSPFVTRLLEASTEGDCLYLALEYVAGPNLARFLAQRRQLDEPTALAVIGDVARGLAVAHARGIVHRDVKPENILLASDAEPRAKMTDFGLARPVDQSRSLEVTQAGVLIGTPLYMAPEQFDGRKVDARADIYALGATLFHLLTGRPPFIGATLEALLSKHLREAPPDLERVLPSTTPGIARLVAKCLAKSPGDRPADAGVFLRQLERACHGEPTGLQGHPRLPEGAGRCLERVYTWTLKASPRQLWPYVSNTDRLNRAVGLPPVQYVFRPDPVLGNRRFATTRVFGMRLEWEEHPFEWIEGQRMGVLREFTRGPFRWFMSVVELSPLPAGGTTLRQTVRLEPRSWLAGLVARLELAVNTPRTFGRVYRRIDQILGEAGEVVPVADAFAVPVALPTARRRRLEQGIEKLVTAGVRPELAGALGEYLATAPAQELARIRPLAVAQRLKVEPLHFVETCLRSVGAGLLAIKWDVICPTCRVPSDQKDTLQELRDHENCAACDASFATDFASAVELVFQVHPEIRQPERGQFCAGGPAHSPHVVAQARVGGNERLELELALTEGTYRIRGPRLPWVAELRVVGGAAGREVLVELSSEHRPALPAVASGGQVLLFDNGRPHEMIVRVERTAGRDDALTAAQATTLPAFRALFPGELLSPGQLARASAVSLLLTRIENGSGLYARLGEARAFQVLQECFRRQEELIRREGGALVKVVEETVYAVFPEVPAAVRAGLALPATLADNPDTAALEVKVAVHRGLVMVATINNRLDYFGGTVKQAGALLEAGAAGELLVTTAVAGDPEVHPLLASLPRQIAEATRPEGGRVLVFRVGLLPA